MRGEAPLPNKLPLSFEGEGDTGGEVELTKKEMNVTTIALISLGIVIGTLIWRDVVSVGEALEILILFVLAVATLGYVKRTKEVADATKEQADASAKMAEEMRAQRYDTVRPVIDIERDPWDEDKMSEAFAMKYNNTSGGLHFRLRNVGVGPALDVNTIMQSGDGRQLQSLGTIAKDGESSHWRLSLEQPDGRTAVVVGYRDVYGRRFQSSREIGRDEEDGLQIEPLKITLVPEDKDDD